ncbi:MAG: lamin tail domain-containing protein [Nanoarchaeota archaeon]
MAFRGLASFLVVGGLAFASYAPVRAGPVYINEAVVDPQQDHSGSGNITPSDEFFELYNSGDSPVSLDGWTLGLIDTTPTVETLSGEIGVRDWFLISDPAGAQNNNGRLELWNDSGGLEDSVSYGNWDDGNILDNAPSGNSSWLGDESLSRYPDGSGNFIKTYATPGRANVPEPMSGLLVLGGLAGLVGFGRRKN